MPALESLVKDGDVIGQVPRDSNRETSKCLIFRVWNLQVLFRLKQLKAYYLLAYIRACTPAILQYSLSNSHMHRGSLVEVLSSN